VKPGRGEFRFVERADAEVDRVGLVIDLHQERQFRTSPQKKR
jgi:hypothetical protein